MLDIWNVNDSLKQSQTTYMSDSQTTYMSDSQTTYMSDSQTMYMSDSQQCKSFVNKLLIVLHWSKTDYLIASINDCQSELSLGCQLGPYWFPICFNKTLFIPRRPGNERS